MRSITLSFIFLFGVLTVNAQNLDEETGFKFVKAEYLFGTERFEDAIKELNDVIKTNPLYKNALLLRAETKYKLAAYKGSKADAMQFIELNGITMQAAAILGKSEYSLINFDPALNSLSAAIALGSKDEKVYEMRADIYEEKGELIKACLDLEEGAKLGSTNAAIKAKKLCGYDPNKNKTKKTEEPKDDESSKEDSEIISDTSDGQNPADIKEDEVVSDGVQVENDEKAVEDPKTEMDNSDDNGDANEVVENDPSIPEDDDTPNRFVVDEDLTISIYGQGLGKRKILEKPSILILSEETGTVAVEVCVNQNGNVEYAEFNSKNSTLSKKSLVSLAIRKAKEYWFEKSDYKKQCGFILFEIKGS